MLNYDYIIRDPVHGDIALTAEEMAILDTVEMQRLTNHREKLFLQLRLTSFYFWFGE